MTTLNTWLVTVVLTVTLGFILYMIVDWFRFRRRAQQREQEHDDVIENLRRNVEAMEKREKADQANRQLRHQAIKNLKRTTH